MESDSSETEPNVLIVDDSDCIRKSLTILLSRRGYRCESAASGIEAVEKVRQSNFNAVITDLQMPEMNGMVLTKELRRYFSDLPVMIMTGQTDDGLMELAIAAGAKEWIGKPFSISDLTARLHRMLRVQENLLGQRAK